MIERRNPGVKSETRAMHRRGSRTKTGGNLEQNMKWTYLRADRMMIQISEFEPGMRVEPHLSTSIDNPSRGVE
jgi:hypothetical protein